MAGPKSQRRSWGVNPGGWLQTQDPEGHIVTDKPPHEDTVRGERLHPHPLCDYL